MKIELKSINMNSEALAAAAARLSRSKGTVLDVWEFTLNRSLEDNVKFIERVIGMGHKSIIDHVYFNLALCDVSPIIEQLLIKSRYCSLTIKSRREVNYGEADYYIPEFRNEKYSLIENQEELNIIYKDNMDKMFQIYNMLIDLGIPKEDSRYVLPYCFRSQIDFGCSATELVRIINLFMKGEYSKISEAKYFGEQLFKIVCDKAPYLVDIIKNSKVNDSNSLKDYINNSNFVSNSLLSEPLLLNKESIVNFDRDIVISSICRLTGNSYCDVSKMVDEMVVKDNKLFNDIFKCIREEISINDSAHEDLSSIYFRFQLPISYANMTHLSRHRGIDLSIPDFDANPDDANMIVPQTISENNDALNLYNYAMNYNFMNYYKLLDKGVCKEDLLYFILSGYTSNVTLGFDGDTFRHVSKFRHCKKAQWEVRGLVTNMIEQLEPYGQFYNALVGATCAVNGNCPEGRESCKIPYPKRTLIK